MPSFYFVIRYPYHFLLSFVNVTKPKKGRCNGVGGKLKKRVILIKNLNMQKRLWLWLCISLQKKMGAPSLPTPWPRFWRLWLRCSRFYAPRKSEDQLLQISIVFAKNWMEGRPSPTPPPSPMLRVWLVMMKNHSQLQFLLWETYSTWWLAACAKRRMWSR